MHPRDIFISHASADKDRYARPLDTALQKYGISTWLDEVQLSEGENFVQSIALGLDKAELVVCLITDRFLGRAWTAKELSVALSSEISSGVTRVVPIFDVVDDEAVFTRFPLLRDKTYVKWSVGADVIAGGLARKFNRSASEWHVFWHEVTYTGPIWTRVVPTAGNLNVVHDVRILWGPYMYTGEVQGMVGGPISLTHHKIKRDSLPMYVEVRPAAMVTIGQGDAPDSDRINIDEGWIRLGHVNFPRNSPTGMGEPEVQSEATA